MFDDNLTDLLEARAADVLVGPPPLAEMHRVAARRRRSYGVALAAAAAVVVTVGAVAVWPDGSGSGRDDAPIASDSPTDPAAGDVPPPGFRWVGMGQAVVAVPKSWPLNATNCGTPATDTVVVDQGVVPLCMALYPAGVTSVEIRAKNNMEEVSSWTPIEVDGEAALRSTDQAPVDAEPKVYRASIYLPERDVMFAASSSVSQEAADEVLTRVAILDALVAVPGISEANYGGEQRKAGENYVRTLEEAGLTAEVVTERHRGGAGFVLGVSPTPGTVVEPGTVVTVTVAR
ncbi:hypothetical protein NSZ01_26440 [Nocardioides szechwanensis]|uniref:PASTA domain-containing protein n=1 Tax=Nocardioides szechwanensis TaxID=1005944 RepID=A0A1H0AFJ3_9ACTN|nr:PASTA domain-containing protein [Nocardioides szechwanensis]GEP34876.1 hypothetical protein NSZ01_26440 [Nocardioides szechwanensis]SDN32071.1 PASTA domain-containing protein [Nocardioides szechwanensis]